MEEPKALLESIRSTRFRYTSEDDLQKGISAVLQAAGISHKREHRLDAKSRIDFMVEGGLGIEVKVDGSVASLGYQVLRYLQCEEIKGIVVVTTRSSHRDLPRELEGKPVWVIHLLTSAF